MAYFYVLRGWLELDNKGFDRAIALLSRLRQAETDEKHLLYLQGWCWNQQPINWQRYLFYGANITEEGMKLFKRTIGLFQQENIAFSGYFQAIGEDDREIIFKSN